MADKVGGIEYYIDANVSGVVDAQEITNKSTTSMQQSFDKVDSAAKRLNGTSKRMPKSANQAQTAISGMGRQAGMASVQLQQMVGQIQGGVNPMIALSQQGADLGIVLGAPLIGSVVGISAALAMNFMPSVFGAKSALEQLEETTASIQKTMAISSGGVAEYTESLRKLASRSESLAKVQIAMGIADASSQIKIATDEIRSSIDDLSQGTFATFNQNMLDSGMTIEDFAKQSVGLNKRFGELNANIVGPMDSSIKGLTRKFGITREQAVELAQALSMFANNKNALGVGALESAFGDLNKQTGFGNQKLLEFTSKMLPLLEAVKSGTDVTNQFRLALSALDDALASEKGAEKFNLISETARDLTNSLAIANANLIGGEQAAKRMAIALSLGVSSVKELPEEMQNVIAALELTEAKQKQIDDDKQAAVKAQFKLEQEIRKQTLEEERENQKIMSEYKALSGDLETGGMSELERIQADFEAKRELIQTHAAILMQDENLSHQEKIAAAKDAGNTMLALDQDINKKKQALAESEKRGKIQAVGQTFSALSSLMNSESKKLFEIGKAAAIGSAIVDGYAAVSKTMASTPYPFNIPLAAAQAAASAVQVQGIAKQKFGGAGGGANQFSAGVPSVNTSSAGGGGGGGFGDRNVSISGLDPSSMFSGEQVRDLLKNLAGDGADFTFLNA